MALGRRVTQRQIVRPAKEVSRIDATKNGGLPQQELC